jgi:hypothetical protein
VKVISGGFERRWYIKQNKTTTTIKPDNDKTNEMGILKYFTF